MTEETYQKILSDIRNMTDEDYEKMLRESREMDKDRERQFGANPSNPWHTGTPTESGDYYVVVRYGSRAGFHGIYSETPAVFSTNFGGIWGNMNIPSNTFDEVVEWMPLEEAKRDICLKCKHGYRPSEKNLLEVWCKVRTKREDDCIFEASSEAEEKQI